MSSQVYIEVAAAPETPTTERGRVLERFARRLLETQHYRVEEEVRLTGTEVDLLAVERATGERVFVECKAHRSTIAAEVLHKILGNVAFRGFSAGWLISTHALGKDAKGMRDEWEQRPPEERRRLQMYDPPRLVERLVAARVIVAPGALARPADLRCAEESYLLLTTFGEFWAVPVLDGEAGMRQAALLYEAATGARVTAPATLSAIAGTDTTLAGLRWLAGKPANPEHEAERLRRELQSIVRIPIAEHWADYRPARPEDFVGRDQLQQEVIGFFDRVRTGQSQTRLFAVKAPSGWGKSSCVLKIASRASSTRGRRRFFVFAVDSRAATSRRFGELALFTALNEAIKAGFVEDPGGLTLGGADNPFATESMGRLLAALRRDNKVVCLVFDQFEELLYKEELEPVFDEMRALCNAVDEAQENLLVGFSWKTDGTIPAEHKAYHLWHSLADRRLEFELAPFTATEVATALNRFSQELGQQLAPQLRRLLTDHCQGFPWLLKKLCIHVLELAKGGMDQSDMLGRSLSIQELFRKDIERLNQTEYACIKQIAAEAPAEFFKISNTYGDDVVNRLLDRRLTVRSGPRLSIYWDIFRDYVLTEKVPYIPVNYIPQANFSNYVGGLRFLLRERETTYEALGAELGIEEATADNLVRDMVMVGNAQAVRGLRHVEAIHEHAGDAAVVLLDFFKSHVVYQRLASTVGAGGTFTEETMRAVTRRVLSAPSSSHKGFSERFLDQCAQKLLRWFRGLGLVGNGKNDADYVLVARPPSPNFLDGEVPSIPRRARSLLLGEAPPEKAAAALHDLIAGVASVEEVVRRHGANALTSLKNLGLIDERRRVQADLRESGVEAAEQVRCRAMASPTVLLVKELVAAKPGISGTEVGAAVAERFGLSWSEGSKLRCGSALKRWARWIGATTPSEELAVG